MSIIASKAAMLPRGNTFFTRDREFYRTFFRLTLVLAMQNIITYSVNVADNVMLGAYSQSALSGAAAVNQLQFILQQVTNSGLGEGLAVLASQYWGQRRTDELQKLTGIALSAAALLGGGLTLAAFLVPGRIVGIFTDDPAILAEALAYLRIMRWSYLLFMTTAILLSLLRSVQIVGIAFRLSVMTLFLNVGINYTLIFGNFGAPALGIRGAAIGTLTARAVELLVLLAYLRFGRALPFRLSLRRVFSFRLSLVRDYVRVTLPCMISSLLFSCTVAMQTAIFGRLTPDAIAANSAASTMFQYGKMIPNSAAAATSVWIGKTIGSGKWDELRSYVRTLQVIYIGIALTFCGMLLTISGPLLKLYVLTPAARTYAEQLVLVMAITSLGTGYQMPSMCGIVRGGGDTAFMMKQDMFYCLVVTIPASLISAFVLHWPVAAVAFCMNVDQLLKCISNFIKTNSYTWIRTLTKAEEPRLSD